MVENTQKTTPSVALSATPIDILGGSQKGRLPPGIRKAILDAEIGDDKPNRGWKTLRGKAA